MSEDFDFEGNNARFNKQKEYALLRTESTESKKSAHQKAPGEKIPETQFMTKEDRMWIPCITRENQNKIAKTAHSLGFEDKMVFEVVGKELASFALSMVKRMRAPDVIVLVGTGGSGQCGLVAARHLANHGAQVKICRSRAYNLSDSLLNLRKLYLETTSGKEAQVGALPVKSVDLILDCLIGVNLTPGPIEESTLTLIQWANNNGAPIISLDVPTGLNCNTGTFRSKERIYPSHTVTLFAPKPGLTDCGQLILLDSGIPQSVFSKADVNFESPFVDGRWLLELQAHSQ